MKFYILGKSIKFRFKIHLLCEFDINYVYSLLFDSGKNYAKPIKKDGYFNT